MNLEVGRNLAKIYELHEAKKRRERPANNFPFVYKYKEGYSNAVKYNLKMSYFLK